MYVCICRGITEKQLMDELTKSHGNDQEVLRRLGVGESCGICLIDAIQTLNKDRDFNYQSSCSSDSKIL